MPPNLVITKPLTSPCSVIEEFLSNRQHQQVGSRTWPNGCPAGRYMKAVWSGIPNVPFKSGKCCVGKVDTEFSWEITNLQFYSGGKSGVSENWNIQCSNHTVITGMYDQILFYKCEELSPFVKVYYWVLR